MIVLLWMDHAIAAKTDEGIIFWRRVGELKHDVVAQGKRRTDIVVKSARTGE